MANAQAGRNLDILELARLTVPIRISQGGHGSTDAKQGLTNLIVNANGVPFKDTDFSGTLKQDTLTDNRTWTLPDETGRLALASKSISQIKQQVFTTSGTYTPTTGMVYCIVDAQASGGAGGGINAGGQAAGAGGGSGARTIKIFSASDIGTSQAVTVGDAGAGVTGDAGGDGEDCTFGDLLTAGGGKGGGNPTPGSGGSATGGDINIAGAAGGESLSNAGTNLFVAGCGGNSTLGQGGAQRMLTTQNSSEVGNPGSGLGSGGSGAISVGSGDIAVAGGAGTKGICVVLELIATN